MKKEFSIDTLDLLETAAAGCLKDFSAHSIFLLSGNLGAGKTTLVQAFCRQLEVTDEVLSPTYTIINEYRRSNGGTVYHADLYRLNSMEEALETGIEDYLYTGEPCFIEWPDLIRPALPPKFVTLDLTLEPATGKRTLTATSHG